MEEKTKLYIAFSSIAFLLLVGTIFYHSVEKWSTLDSFYFTSTTLTTIGYGDFHPITDAGKLGTVALAFSGVAIVLYALTIIGTAYFERREKRLLEMEENRYDTRLKELVKGTANTIKETAGNIKETAVNVKSTFSDKLKDKSFIDSEISFEKKEPPKQ